MSTLSFGVGETALISKKENDIRAILKPPRYLQGGAPKLRPRQKVFHRRTTWWIRDSKKERS